MMSRNCHNRSSSQYYEEILGIEISEISCCRCYGLARTSLLSILNKLIRIGVTETVDTIISAS